MKIIRRTSPSDRLVNHQALKGITKIVPFFHRIKLSSNLSYEWLNELFPESIKQPNNSGDIASLHTGKMYRNVAWLWLPSIGELAKQRITINYNPTVFCYPKSQLSITNPTAETLAYLDKKFSHFEGSKIKVSSAEYTVDFYCKDPTSVSNLFYVFRRNYYCPHAKSTSLKGGPFYGYSHEQDYSVDRQTNAVFFIDFSRKHVTTPSKRVKFYERGSDKDRLHTDQFWPHNKCDRVRYEATITTKLLRKFSISFIKDFLTDPKFSELLFPSGTAKGLLQFKRFINKQYQKYSPPTCNQDYYHRMSDSYSFECFIEEVIHAKKEGLDLSNSLEDHPQFNKLVTQIAADIKTFEYNWKKAGVKAIKYFKNTPITSIVLETEPNQTVDAHLDKNIKTRLKDFMKNQ